jgi:DNA-binding transcriptional ArsR family regulator
VARPQPSLSLAEALRLFRLLGKPTRLRLLVLLAARGEASVGDLVAASGLSFGNVSAHLGLLRLASVVATRREGQKILYRINSPPAAEVLRGVCEE